MSWGYLLLIIVISVAVYGLIFWRQKNQSDKLISEGKIIKRKGAFWEKCQDFILNPIDSKLLVQKLESLPYADMEVSVKADAGKLNFLFSHYGFQAKLQYIGREDEKDVYHFQFLSWQTRNGGVSAGFQMNMLLTALEKMFLDLDRSAQVRTQVLETRTKIHI